MMVEAGGTEKSFDYYDDGAPKVDEAVLAGGLEACKVWIKESIALQRQLVASVIATNGPITPLTFTAGPRLQPRRVRRRRAASPPTSSPRRSRSPARPSATPPPTPPPPRRSPRSCGEGGEFAGQREGDQGGRPQPDQEARSASASSTRACASTVVASPTCVRSRAEVGVLPTAHGSGLFQRGETQVHERRARWPCRA